MATTVGSTTSTSAVSFQGLSTGLQTDSLVEAIMQQASQPLTRLQAKQTQNTTRSTLLQTMNTDLLNLSSAINDVNLSGLTANTVSSSDANGTYVTATASGAANGNYSVTVNQVAVAAQSVYEGQITGTPSTYSLGGTAGSDGNYHYTITGTNGTNTDISLAASNNTLAGLRDAINASSSTTGVSASLVQLNSSGSNYAVVLNATATGLGSGGGNTVSLALGNGSNSNPDSALASFLSATKPSGSGLQNSTTKAVDANFTLNGVTLTRSSNVVTDAVQGMTFTLKSAQGSSTPATVLTVATDKAAATTALQGVVDKFNAVLKLYQSNSGTDSSGNPGAFANDFNLRTMISNLRSKIMSPPSGLSSTDAYSSAASLGLKTNRDGTMSLDSAAFQSALDTNPSSAADLFSAVGTSLVGYVNSVTAPGSGDIARVMQSIDTQNANLTQQISTMQTYLDRKRTLLQNEYSQLEVTVGQLQSVGKSLSGLSSSTTGA